MHPIYVDRDEQFVNRLMLGSLLAVVLAGLAMYYKPKDPDPWQDLAKAPMPRAASRPAPQTPTEAPTVAVALGH